MEGLRLVFFGTPWFAVPVLKVLIAAGGEVVGVVTRPTARMGRSLRMQETPVAKAARDFGIPVFTPFTLKEKGFVGAFSSLRANAAVVAAYGRFIPSDLLSVPPFGFVNLHPSLLPLYRGAAPVQRALMDGAEKTGITVMMVDPGMDSGPILLQEESPIGPEEDAESLTERLFMRGADLLVEGIAGLMRKEIKPVPQDHSKATFAPALKKEDGHIAWQRGAGEIANLVRGTRPWPGAHTSFRGKMVEVVKASATECEEEPRPGEVVSAGVEGLIIGCGKGALRIDLIHPEGKRPISGEEFVRGYRVKKGDLFGVEESCRLKQESC